MLGITILRQLFNKIEKICALINPRIAGVNIVPRFSYSYGGFIIRACGSGMKSRNVEPYIKISFSSLKLVMRTLYFDSKKRITYNFWWKKPIKKTPKNLYDLIVIFSRHYIALLTCEPWLKPSSWIRYEVPLGTLSNLAEVARRILVLAIIKVAFLPKVDPKTMMLTSYSFSSTLIKYLWELHYLKSVVQFI